MGQKVNVSFTENSFIGSNTNLFQALWKVNFTGVSILSNYFEGGQIFKVYSNQLIMNISDFWIKNNTF